jgi:ribosome-associated protein
MMKEFNLENNDFIPLCDMLKTMGLCQTGGHAKSVIAEGLVKVDGAVELRKRCKIKQGQIVEYDGQKIKVLAKNS